MSALVCAYWCAGGCDSGTSCLSWSEDRTVPCTGDGKTPDERGELRYKEVRVYLQRNVGWPDDGLPEDAVTTVHLLTEVEGWNGCGDDVGMTVEQARMLAAYLLECADRASVDRASLLAAGHSVTAAASS